MHGQVGESADLFCFDCVFIRELDTWSENFQKSFQLSKQVIKGKTSYLQIQEEPRTRT